MLAARHSAGRNVLFALTVFLSAALLFFVQPLFSKLILPRFGGSPTLWNTCLVFFQTTLLAGYVYSHLITTKLPIAAQVALHAIVVLLPLATLPIAVAEGGPPPNAASPVMSLLGVLAVGVGLPVFVVSTTAPLLQSWYGRLAADHEEPYFLYAVSNIGSLGILIGYPLIVEPVFLLTRQSALWAGGYGLFAILVLMCGAVAWRAGAGSAAEIHAAKQAAGESTITLATRLR